MSYFCRSGYMLIPDVSPITTCLKNFTWSAVPQLCQRKYLISFTWPTKHQFDNVEITSFSKLLLVLLCHKGFPEQYFGLLIIILQFKG